MSWVSVMFFSEKKVWCRSYQQWGLIEGDHVNILNSMKSCPNYYFFLFFFNLIIIVVIPCNYACESFIFIFVSFLFRSFINFLFFKIFPVQGRIMKAGKGWEYLLIKIWMVRQCLITLLDKKKKKKKKIYNNTKSGNRGTS